MVIFKVYLDDVLLDENDWDEMVHELWKMRQKLIEAGYQVSDIFYRDYNPALVETYSDMPHFEVKIRNLKELIGLKKLFGSFIFGHAPVSTIRQGYVYITF